MNDIVRSRCYDSGSDVVRSGCRQFDDVLLNKADGMDVATRSQNAKFKWRTWTAMDEWMLSRIARAIGHDVIFKSSFE